MSIEAQLQKMAIHLPAVRPSQDPYTVSSLKVGNLVFISSQTSQHDGEMLFTGKINSLEEGKQAAFFCGLNILAQLKTALKGRWEKVSRCVKVVVFIHCDDEFREHLQVADGVSELFVNVFGEEGKHIRSFVSCNALPSDAMVMVEAIFETK